MGPKCDTCQWNFPPQGERLEGRICANVYYDDYIKDIQKENRICDDYKISFEEFCRVRNAKKMPSL